MIKRKSVFGAAFSLACVFGTNSATAQQGPLYFNFVDTVFQAIEKHDPSTFACLSYIGRDMQQVWDKRVDGEPVINAYVFDAHFSDGKVTKVVINPEFGSPQKAQAEAMRYMRGLGQIPATLRANVNRLSVHKGREGFHAGTGQIVMYADQATRRIKANHLEESLFHEAVHASWDANVGKSRKWKTAQRKDGRFLTRYGASAPKREDLAESALFIYALGKGRIPPADARDIKHAIPHRIALLDPMLRVKNRGLKKPAACP